MNLTNFRFETDADGVALATWDMPGRSMNVITPEVMDDLNRIIDAVVADSAIKGCVITSGKDTFSGGADLTMLQGLGAEYARLSRERGEEEAMTFFFEESRRLTLLYRKLETCGKPFAAAVHGTCLGGAFELALACHHRVVSDDDKTRVGLPEIKVGLFPGAGGTQRVARLMQTDLTVMISGESGTGKELVARALHDYGKRRKGPFVALNMAAIPRELIESELFGHERGAFTGAVQRSAGKFEQAAGGTLFLDEIGDMPPEAQTRLLRVLQEGEYTTVGGRTPIKANVRIVAATHRDLRRLIQQGLFREDLFYRLNVVPIRLPPLRERLDDIPELTNHYLRLATADGLPAKVLSPEAMARLKQHRWPGNVRELVNLVRRLSALYSEEVIGLETIEAIREIKKLFPRVHTSLGVSNISFGLSPHARHVLNSVFLDDTIRH